MRHVYTPFGNSKHSQLPGFKNRIGRGIGSVLLQTGGPGAGSSYPSVESYEKTTGRHIPMPSLSGRGLAPGLKSKIQALMPKPQKEQKRKNINFSL
jgi:hypothetical protein